MRKILLFFLTGCFVVIHADMPKLVELNKIIPHIMLDIKYATENNFTKHAVYPTAQCFLLEPAAMALKAAAHEFMALGNYRIKVWDGYRPLSVQEIFWQLVPDERYVADPKKGSRHNRGCAVDLTLVDAQGNELDMGTEFDDFSEKAHRNNKNFGPQVIKNRELLQTVMEKHGFAGLDTEWWHFDYKGWEQYPILNVAMNEIK